MLLYQQQCRLRVSDPWVEGGTMAEYKIDDVSKLTGLTKRAIRYYEDLGLITSPKRSEGGVRLYTSEHIQQLREIVELKNVLGFTLQELKQVIEMKNMAKRLRKQYQCTLDLLKMEEELHEAKKMLSEQLTLLEYKLEKIQLFRDKVKLMKKQIESALSKVDEMKSEVNGK
jgi:DNA-binding transcriptional MerR regulator